MENESTQLVPRAMEGVALRREEERSLFLNMGLFEQAQKVATVLANSTMIPEHFQKSVSNCLIALNFANRVGVDVFAAMQNIYVVHGRPGIEGKLAISLVEGSGRFSPLEYRFKGEGKTSEGIPRPDECVAFATDLKTGKVVDGPAVTWKMAEVEGWLDERGQGPKKQKSKWQTMPQLMFMYRAAMFFARVHCPGALLGLRTADELEDMWPAINITPATAGDPGSAAENVYDDQGDLIAKFNESIPQGTDPSTLEAFLKGVASKMKKTIDQVKAQSLTDSKNFWEAFQRYAHPEPKKAERKKAAPPSEPKPEAHTQPQAGMAEEPKKEDPPASNQETPAPQAAPNPALPFDNPKIKCPEGGGEKEVDIAFCRERCFSSRICKAYAEAKGKNRA